MSLVVNGKTKAAKNSSNARIFLLLFIAVLYIGLISARIFYLQVSNSGYYQALAENQHEMEKEILPKRGEIFLTSKNSGQHLLAATNISKSLVFTVPKDISDKPNTAAKLARLLGITEQEVLDKIVKGNKNYTVIARQLTDDIAKAIAEQKMEGVHLEAETVRYYPEGSLASHVLGFVGYSGNQRVGQYGIEGRFEKNLSGSKGIIGVEKDLAGRWITFASRNLTPAQDGESIYLTIDPAIQFKAQEVLARSIESHQATNGSVIVADPKTGAILAMANYPDFNPNAYSKISNLANFANQTVANDYEPGSIFKTITMAGAINEGKITPETTYEDFGEVQLDDYKIKNSDGKAHGVQNMNYVLEQSLNTGLVFVQKQLGQELFRKYAKDFGFGQQTKIELPGEARGNIENLNKKGEVFFGTASYGQGITATPVQMIQAYTAIANGGKMMQPYIISKILHSNGFEEKTEPKIVQKVLEPKTAATVSAMLVNVVENGHGKRAGVPGYYIAGKTGTAQVPYADKAGYDPTKTIGSFIGYGPVDNPAFLMLVRIDNPKGVRFAESTAAPAFGEIAAFILNYLQIPPIRQ
jgi:stage V sporulation protein D (sporulation-specific penicillin-binding protein)